jgi:hypothetical protein
MTKTRGGYDSMLGRMGFGRETRELILKTLKLFELNPEPKGPALNHPTPVRIRRTNK